MKTIALIYGGNSSEREISIYSGKNVAQYINASKYRVFEVLITDISWTVENCDTTEKPQIDKSTFSFIYKEETIYFDAALIMVHGTPGENGLLQSYLDLLHVPYTTCSAALSMATFDKYTCKCLLRDSAIDMAKEVRVSRKQIELMTTEQQQDFASSIIAKVGLPAFVKPNAEGSSYGVRKVNRAQDLLPAIFNSLTYDNYALVEEYIAGRELTNGIFKAATTNGTVKTYTLPVTEIVPDEGNEFFDYEAKYLGKSKEITPAPISESLSRLIQKTSSYIYDYLGCSGMVRMDYIARQDGKVFFLEVNSVPGMSKMSLVPQMLAYAGYTMEEFLDNAIEDAILRSGKAL